MPKNQITKRSFLMPIVQGASMVEVAVTLPIFLALVLFIVDLGRYFFIYTLLNYAVSQGGDYAVKLDIDLPTKDSDCQGTSPTPCEKFEGYVNSILDKTIEVASLVTNPSGTGSMADLVSFRHFDSDEYEDVGYFVSAQNPPIPPINRDCLILRPGERGVELDPNGVPTATFVDHPTRAFATPGPGQGWPNESQGITWSIILKTEPIYLRCETRFEFVTPFIPAQRIVGDAFYFKDVKKFGIGVPPVDNTFTPVPTNTFTPLPSDTPTETPTSAVLPSDTPTETPVPALSNTSTATPSVTRTSTVTKTSTITHTPTITLTPTKTATRTITPTRTRTPTRTNTPTRTPTCNTSFCIPGCNSCIWYNFCDPNDECYQNCPQCQATCANCPTPTPTRTATPTPTCAPACQPVCNACGGPCYNQTTNTCYLWCPGCQDACANCATATPTATRTRTPTNTATMTLTITNTRTITPTRTRTGTPTRTATITLTPTITLTRTVTLSPTITMTRTSTPTKTDDPWCQNSGTTCDSCQKCCFTNEVWCEEHCSSHCSTFNCATCPTPTPTRTRTPTPTQTDQPYCNLCVTCQQCCIDNALFCPDDCPGSCAPFLGNCGACPTSTPTPTRTLSPTRTATPTRTLTFTITPTITLTPTNTATLTLTPTITSTPTETFTPTNTATITLTPTRTHTLTHTRTHTSTPTLTKTPTPTVTPTPTFDCGQCNPTFCSDDPMNCTSCRNCAPPQCMGGTDCVSG